jgi:hypothetical protein
MCFAYEQACIHHIHAQKADVPGEKQWSFILLDVINLVVCRCRSQLESGEERNIAPPLRLLHAPSNLYVSSLVAVLLIYLFAYLLQQLLNQSSPSPAATLVCAALWYLLLKLALCSFWSHFLVSQTKTMGGWTGTHVFADGESEECQRKKLRKSWQLLESENVPFLISATRERSMQIGRMTNEKNRSSVSWHQTLFWACTGVLSDTLCVSLMLVYDKKKNIAARQNPSQIDCLLWIKLYSLKFMNFHSTKYEKNSPMRIFCGL